MVHTLREGNVYSDFLAKYGALQDALLVVLDIPLSGLTRLLVMDDVDFLNERG